MNRLSLIKIFFIGAAAICACFTNANAQMLTDTLTNETYIQTWDSLNKLTFRVSAGGLMLTPNISSDIDYGAYSVGFTQYDTRITSIMHNSQGFILRNEVHLNLKENPISFSADLAYGFGNFNMLEFDTNGNQMSHTWFRKINLTTLGIGVDIGGKYFNFGVKYRIGTCFGGHHQEQLPYVPNIIKDNQLNLISNSYQGLEFSVGAQYNRFFLKFRRVYPLSKPINMGFNLFTGLFSSSIEIGYILKIRY